MISIAKAKECMRKKLPVEITYRSGEWYIIDIVQITDEDDDDVKYRADLQQDDDKYNKCYSWGESFDQLNIVPQKHGITWDDLLERIEQ